jgi:uncharacterized membrane protein
MQTIERTIEVERPVGAVYEQWTQFQDFPKFMEGIKEVRPVDDVHLHWKAEIGGRVKRWDAEIVERVPDQRIRWRSTSGAENLGAVTFISITPAKTRVILYLAYEPKGIFENLGDNLGLVSAKVTGDLNRFKKYIESQSVRVKTGRIAGAAVPASP